MNANQMTRYGSIPACAALGACDIATAVVDGRQVYCTWGRNLTRDQADQIESLTEFVPIRNPADGELYELIIPDEMVESLIPALTAKAFARRAGAARSERKTAASRENGRRGGRPRRGTFATELSRFQTFGGGIFVGERLMADGGGRYWQQCEIDELKRLTEDDPKIATRKALRAGGLSETQIDNLLSEWAD